MDRVRWDNGINAGLYSLAASRLITYHLAPRVPEPVAVGAAVGSCRQPQHVLAGAYFWTGPVKLQRRAISTAIQPVVQPTKPPARMSLTKW